jgi:hypothetical protein
LATVVDVGDVGDGGTVTPPAVVVAAPTTVVGTDAARKDDRAADGFDDPEHDARPSSTSGNRIRKDRIRKR